VQRGASKQVISSKIPSETSATVKWDSAISLAFAAENLFAAAQLLTSDIVPWKRALRLSYERHLVPLIENDDFLPPHIREELLEAHRSYLRASSRGLNAEFARQLASELMKILKEISAILNHVPGPSLLSPGIQAA
jgi:hypothetical protein